MASFMRCFASLLLLPLLLAACSDDEPHKHVIKVLYSPNGEPLNGGSLGNPPCEQAFSNWLAQADTNHDGVLDREEFLADAKAQFKRMDIDHNGYLVSEELDRYRAPYWRSLQLAEQRAERRESKRSRKPSIRHDSESGSESMLLIDPVMSADTNLDFKVTQDEFLTQVQKNFDELDRDHNGRLDKQEVTAVCHAADK
ncbi:MAG TPA: hypothetical protein VFT64_07255 [Rickettsiales bacterium]|nr:hypothetical protein [Rickettsiales bacterium]